MERHTIIGNADTYINSLIQSIDGGQKRVACSFLMCACGLPNSFSSNLSVDGWFHAEFEELIDKKLITERILKELKDMKTSLDEFIEKLEKTHE